MSTAEDTSRRFFAMIHKKDKVLRNIFGENFSDSSQQHLHGQDILQSISCLIWDFLPSCLDGLPTLWLEICVPKDKFDFSGDNCSS